MENNEISSSEQKRDCYAMIPNIVDCIGLSPHAYRLYGHFKRVIGEEDDGICWQSTTTLANTCNMSTGSVSNAKKELLEHNLIVITEKKNDRFVYHNITVTDIWHINHGYFVELKNGGDGRSYLERLGVIQQVNDYRSTGETKNNPPSEEEPNAGASPSQGNFPSKADDIAAENEQKRQDEESVNPPSELDAHFGPREPTPPSTLPEKVNLHDKDERERYALKLQEQRAARVNGEPWLTSYEWVTPRNGVTRETLQRVAHTLVTAGIPEPESNAVKAKWKPALEAVYIESGGDFELIKRAGVAMVAGGLQFWPTHKWVDQVIALKAEKSQGKTSAFKARSVYDDDGDDREIATPQY